MTKIDIKLFIKITVKNGFFRAVVIDKIDINIKIALIK